MSYNLDQQQKSTCWYDVIPYCTENVGKEKKYVFYWKHHIVYVKKKQQKNIVIYRKKF